MYRQYFCGVRPRLQKRICRHYWSMPNTLLGPYRKGTIKKMPVTTLHLSSANSTQTAQGTHELRLEPGLQKKDLQESTRSSNTHA